MKLWWQRLVWRRQFLEPLQPKLTWQVAMLLTASSFLVIRYDTLQELFQDQCPGPGQRAPSRTGFQHMLVKSSAVRQVGGKR